MTVERTVCVVPHTHWDREWYEPQARFGQRLVAVLDRIIELLEQKQGLPVFLLDGQAVLLEDYLAVRPEQAARVERLARAEKLLVGPWYVLSDELLSSDECLVRNLLVGRRCGERFGHWLAVGYSPDAFGHPAALPTILRGFGMRHAIVWRGYGGEPGEEQDLFDWIGPDGARVRVHHLPPRGYSFGARLPLERRALERRWRAIAAVLVPRAADRSLLLMNGADHHGPQGDLPRVVKRLNRSVPHHRFVIASPTRYFAALPASPRIPEVEGELRFSYRHAWTLQGVHATRARLKAAIAAGEQLLIRWAEPQAALAWVAGGAERSPLLHAAWREHLRNTFHDTLAGSSTDAVAQDAAVRARHVIEQARGIVEDALHDRLRQDRRHAPAARDAWEPALVVVNPSAGSRSGVVEAVVTVSRAPVAVGRRDPTSPALRRSPIRPPALTAPDGTRVPVQLLDRYDGYERLDSVDAPPLQDRVWAFRVALFAEDVPPLGARAYRVEGRGGGRGGRGGRANRRVVVRGERLRSDWCEVAADAKGGFALVAQPGGPRLERLGRLVSERDEGDTYTFEPVMGDEPHAARWFRPRTVYHGPLVAAIARRFALSDRVRGMVSVRLDAGSRLVRFVVQGVNLQGGHRLRVHFPLPRDGWLPVSVAGMHYGPVTRVREDYDLRDYPREWPVATAPMHRYVSVPGGLTVFARGRFEYELTEEGTLAVTLFRAVGELSRGDLAARPGHAGWPTATPGAQELGPFHVELAVTLADSTVSASVAAERLAEEFHAPLGALMLRYGIRVPNSIRGPALEGRGLVVKAVKPAERGGALVLRCVNVTDQPTRGVWTCPFAIGRARRARLDETPGTALTVVGGGRQVAFRAGPREVVTVLLEPAGRRSSEV